MKKLRFYLLTIVALLCSMGADAQVYYFEDGYLRYQIDLDLSKTDAMVRGYSYDMPADVVIPDTVNYNGQTFNVTAISGDAFYECTSLRSIDLGKVTKIVDGYFSEYSSRYYGAFRGCTGLTSIDLKNVTAIGEGAFDGCTGLTSIDLQNVTNLGFHTFANCTGLTSIDLKNVKTIGSYAFGDCKGIISVDLKNVTTINYRAFDGCDKINIVRTSETEAPSLDENSFEAWTMNFGKLYVPLGSKQKYMNHAVWSKFPTIEEVAVAEKNLILSVTCSKGGSVSFKGVTAANGVQSVEAPKGEVIEMTFTAEKGYELESVKVDGADVTASVKDNKYSVTLDKNVKVEVMFSELPISLTIRDAESGSIEFIGEKGKAYTFKINESEGWKINTVTFNGTDVTSQLDANNGFTTPAITENSILNVSFESTNSAITEVMSSDIRVSAYDSEIMVEGVTSGTPISIYTQNGALVASMTSSGNDMKIAVEPGQVYIVKAGNRTFKVSC